MMAFFSQDNSQGDEAEDGKFSTFGTDSAYIFAIIHSSWKPFSTQV